MAYDLLVGKGNTVYAVGAIEFSELPAISKLLKRMDSYFLHHVSNLFDDQVFSSEEIGQALAELLQLMPYKLQVDERAMLQKLISILSFAKWKELEIYCVAD